MQINQPKGNKPKTRSRKLRRGISWQEALKRNSIEQDLCLFPPSQYSKCPNFERFSTWILYVSLPVWRPVNRKTMYFINKVFPYNFLSMSVSNSILCPHQHLLARKCAFRVQFHPEKVDRMEAICTETLTCFLIMSIKWNWEEVLLINKEFTFTYILGYTLFTVAFSEHSLMY